MNKHVHYIKNRLRLREPQAESLEILDQIVPQLEMKKNVLLKVEEQKVRNIIPIFQSFEREFPSICFSLATGVGKTRLMGAFIAYLYYEKGIKNFFVMAPNLTIYNKLLEDLGNPVEANKKYVFRGLDAFTEPPRIINGDNFEEFRQTTITGNGIVINLFNISKLNAETRKGSEPRIKKLNEVLGESYFNYLKSLPDLVLLMDESHHYRADRGMTVINELQPILGIELTATPQTQNGTKKIRFENVVYEYSLAHALDDGKYVKVPAVATRKNFDPSQYTDEELDKIKLEDGIRLHIDTQVELEKYARETGKPIIKPFVLVVAKDTEHSGKLKEYISSSSFFNGAYKDKVLEIHSNQKGSEKDENITQLLSLEDPNNRIEIVIHVNMLKEGWDVTNLYTIIPLRRSASDTLTEQTIGRGLRLPYGERTKLLDKDGNIHPVDRLTIVHHDKYDDIIRIANDPNSILKKIYIIEIDPTGKMDQKEVIEIEPSIENILQKTENKFATEISDTIAKTSEKKQEIAKYITNAVYRRTIGLNKYVTLNDIKKQENQEIVYAEVIRETQAVYLDIPQEEITTVIRKIVKDVTQNVTLHSIPIPRATVQNNTKIIEAFDDFDLDTKNLNYYPTDEIIKIKNLETGKESTLESKSNTNREDTPENTIVTEIIRIGSNIDYEKNSDLLFKLVEQAKIKFISYLSKDNVEQVMFTRKKDIAEFIYSQMTEHFRIEETKMDISEMLSFVKIEPTSGEKFKSDSIIDIRETISSSEIRGKIFNGFSKSCHTMYKFDSSTEKKFAELLENDYDVLKWMRPSKKQFNIWWDKFGQRQYEPDFIVETEESISMIEIKMSKEIDAEEVRLKMMAAMSYCESATEFNEKKGGKPWKYMLIPHDSILGSTSYEFLEKQYTKTGDAL